MTQKEKIIMLKDTIIQLYEKEGRNKSYISKLLNVNRGVLTKMINEEWKLVQANVRHLNPSNQKFLNRNKQLIKSRLDRDYTASQVAKELGVDSEYLRRTIIANDDVLDKAMKDNLSRREKQADKNREKAMDKSSFNYNIVDKDGEEWKGILGYENYFISNYGRVKKYAKRYGSYYLLTPNINPPSNRVYIQIGGKGLAVHRLVGFAFIEGYSEINNTINHKDLNPQNNHYTNLEWVSQSENNLHAYKNGRSKVRSYQKNGRFKEIHLTTDKGVFKFKTIVALAKFLGKSETQVQRYISNESQHNYKFKFIY